MPEVTIRETCSCGATFEISGGWASILAVAAADWRRGHEHNPPSLTPPTPPPDGPDKPTPVEGSHHDAPETPTSLGFTPPSTDPWRWGDR